MSSLGPISHIHIKKLDHDIEEIRVRALENVVSKVNNGYQCDCNAIKKELLAKLFKWFSLEPNGHEDKVLNLMIDLIKSDDSYLSAFGQLRFQNELRDLRLKLDARWHDKVGLLEEVAENPCNFSPCNFDRKSTTTHNEEEINSNQKIPNGCAESSSYSIGSPLDSSVPFELTMNYENSTVISRKSDNSIKWLGMPWQVLVSSDKGIISQLEDSLNNSPDIHLRIKNCQFITNILLQDFPAEVFLQRPTAFNILLGLLQVYKNDYHPDSQNLVITILKTFHKLTRSLRFRIYYYCDPSIAHKAQKILARILESEHSDLLGRDSPEGEPPDDPHNQQYERMRVNHKNPYSIDDEDDALLQLHQIFIPHYCSEALLHVLKLLSCPSDPIRPLRTVKHISDLVYELIQLLITSVMPTVWFCNDNVALKIQESLRILLEVLSEILDYYGQFFSIDYFRIQYLYFLWTAVKLMSNIVPLELADQVIPKKMKLTICTAIMDAPIFLIFPEMHITLQEYARKFRGTQESDTIKLLDETRIITKSIKAAISLIKDSREQSYSDDLKAIYASKFSLMCHRNFKIIKKFIKLAQNMPGYKLTSEDVETTQKMLLSLLANNDDEIQEFTYTECHTVVVAVLRSDCGGQFSWKNLLFLMETSVLIEIICYGKTSENQKVKKMAEEILLFLIEGRIQLSKPGWSRFLEALVPILPLLQCFTDNLTPLGKAIGKMFDPDVSTSIKLPLLEVLKGNIRSLFSPISDVRDESLCRIMWMLSQEKNSSQKLPRLSALHDLPLSTICVFSKQILNKRSDGIYQRNLMGSLIEMLRSESDPKIRKSTLVQFSLMLTDCSLHQTFVSENGLPLILDIFSKALIESEYSNYPDSVIPVISILKLLISSDSSLRKELSYRTDVYYNILRSLFLYPHNEGIKVDAAQLLTFLLYDDYIMKVSEKSTENPYSISLPLLINTKMKLPITCKSHWKTSIHKRPDISILYRNNPTALTFIRQFWAWEWHGGERLLKKKLKDVNDLMLNANLIMSEKEFDNIAYTSLQYCVEEQLFNIQHASTHNGVSKGIDFLTMCLKLGHLLNDESFGKIQQQPWSNTFERFLQSHPTNKEDHELLTNILNFLHLYVKLMNGEETKWLHKAVKNMVKSLSDWLSSSEMVSDDLHQAVLKLARATSILDSQESNKTKNPWICFVKFAVSNLLSGEYYNLAFLDWMLSTLTLVIGKCYWADNKETLVEVGSALIELILSFYREGTVRFMGLAITRDCIICLNHILHQMQINLGKNLWTKFWYDQNQSLGWLPTLWKSRDPLVRASALQLLASLINGPHTAIQLLNAIDLSPGELCLSLLYFITTQEESCIVKEEACLAMSNLIKNSNSIAFQYIDSLKPSAILTYIKENNVYHEIAIMCTNLYRQSSLDPDMSKSSEPEGAQTQSLASLRTISSLSIVPKTINQLYNCEDDIQRCSAGNSEVTADDDLMQFITTPSLMTSLCLLLNNLISIGEEEVIHEIFEHSLYKYIIECFGEVPRTISGDNNLEHYCNVLEMYTSLCTVLTNCILHSSDFASIVTFPADFIQHLFELLNRNLYFDHTTRLIQLYNRLATEIFKFLSCLSLTENQHYGIIQSALENCNTESFIKTVCDIIKSSKSELGISALSFLTFLLSQEMQRECEDDKVPILKEVLDNKLSVCSIESSENDLKTIKSTACLSSIENPIDRNVNTAVEAIPIGADICKTLIELFVAHNHTKPLKKCKIENDKEIITVTLTNLLCISMEAKKLAIELQFPCVTLLVLKEIYIKLNNIPFHTFKSQIDRNQKMPLFQEIDSIYTLLMNYMYDSEETKEVYAKAGLADVIHKLWAYSSLNKKLLISTLKLLSTFTSNCIEASKSLSLTTVTPGVGLKKTPNSISLVHVLVQLVTKEIDTMNRNCDCQKLNYAFYVLRNVIHNHECRVVISKSNLLTFFSKIHPVTTKRTKVSQIVEVNCLEFLIDFTYYDEGQLSVSKATDSLEVLIQLAQISNGSTRLLAISILRNLAFNATNRPRLLGSTDFLKLLLYSLKEGTTTDIEIAGSTLWSLVSNNQKNKVIARSAGFLQAIQMAISRLSLSCDDNQERELIKMLEYVQQIINST